MISMIILGIGTGLLLAFIVGFLAGRAWGWEHGWQAGFGSARPMIPDSEEDLRL